MGRGGEGKRGEGKRGEGEREMGKGKGEREMGKGRRGKGEGEREKGKGRRGKGEWKREKGEGGGEKDVGVLLVWCLTGLDRTREREGWATAVRVREVKGELCWAYWKVRGLEDA